MILDAIDAISFVDADIKVGFAGDVNLTVGVTVQ
jgi:hypothetical protein